MPAKKKVFNIEEALETLEDVVSALEAGDLSLEDAMKHFENGIKTSRECQKALENAKLKVEKLIETTNGGIETTPFLDD